MTTYIEPYTFQVDLARGEFQQAGAILLRHLSDMRGMFADTAAEEALLPENPLIYEVRYPVDVPEVAGQLGFCTTVIYPGKVGDEYFMTKGHFHRLADRAEVYYGLKGKGILIMQTPEGRINTQTMIPGSVSYVPPYWAHRTVNIGAEPFAFLAVYPADAGYNYGIIAEQGFASIVVERDGNPALVPNPRYRPRE